MTRNKPTEKTKALILKHRQEETQKLIRENLDMSMLLNCRAGKLLKKGTPFIVVSIKEDYYPMVYRTIRTSEKRKGTWTEQCETDFWCAITDWMEK